MDVDLLTLLFLFATAALAGFIDAIAGGGGLLTVPALLVAGAAPLQALATNKAQSVFGSGTASLTLLRGRVVQWDDVRPGVWRSALGAAVGAAVVQQFDPAALEVVIPVVLLGIGGYLVFAPTAGEVERAPRITAERHRDVVVPAIGFYDGMFGPGTGSFFAVSGVALRGLRLVPATAMAKTFNFGSNLGALAVFLVGGEVVWAAAGAMMAGQVVGAWAGAHTMVRGGTRLIRPLVVLMSVAMLVRWVVT